ncbi:retrovirus-related pol polyprotein from transposon TNT 1-94 [Tanacetum coccineum]
MNFVRRTAFVMQAKLGDATSYHSVRWSTGCVVVHSRQTQWQVIWKIYPEWPYPHPLITDLHLLFCCCVLHEERKRILDSVFRVKRDNKDVMADNQAEIILKSRTIQQRKRKIVDEYERFCAMENESIHDYVIYTHSKAYEPYAKKTLKKQEQSTSIVDPLAYVAHTTSAPALSSPSTPSPQPTAQSPNDALMATMTQIANLLTNHEDAYDSDVDEGPNAAVAFMANLSSTSATNNPVNEYLLDTEAQNVPTEVSADTSDKISMIAILTDLQTQLDGHAKIPTRSNLIFENKVRLGTSPSSVIQRNKKIPIAFLQSEKEKILFEKKDLADTSLTNPVSIWDSEGCLVHQLVSMKKMYEKNQDNVRPAIDFYAKLNALMFVPQKELSRDQVYWLSANEIASQASKPTTPATPFVHKSRPPSHVLASLQKVNVVFHQFEGLVHIVLCIWDSGCSKKLTWFRKTTYSISLNDMMYASPVCLLTMPLQQSLVLASSVDSYEFRNLNDLARNYSSLEVISKKLHSLKSENTILKFSILTYGTSADHMRTESINGKKLCFGDSGLIHQIWMDNGTEFVNQTLDGWFESVGISHETSVPRSPQQNGVVERRNRTLMEAARTMLIFARKLMDAAVLSLVKTQNPPSALTYKETGFVEFQKIHQHVVTTQESSLWGFIKAPSWVGCHDTRSREVPLAFRSISWDIRLVSWSYQKQEKYGPLHYSAASPIRMLVLKISGCALNYETMDLRFKQNFRVL